MENDHSIPFDAPPKRRKHKDNPYTIRTSGIHTDHPRYFLEFQDGQGVTQFMELSKELYETFDQFELEDLSELNKIDRHYGGSLDADAAAATVASPLEEAIHSLDRELLHTAIDALPEAQKRRIRLYYFEGMTYQQIADMEGCAKVTVYQSIDAARKKLAAFF